MKSEKRKLGAGYTLLALAMGMILLAVDLLPLGVWGVWAYTSGAASESVRAWFIGAALFSAAWAYGIHQGVHALQCRRTAGEAAGAAAEAGDGATTATLSCRERRAAAKRPRPKAV